MFLELQVLQPVRDISSLRPNNEHAIDQKFKYTSIFKLIFYIKVIPEFLEVIFLSQILKFLFFFHPSFQPQMIRAAHY